MTQPFLKIFKYTSFRDTLYTLYIDIQIDKIDIVYNINNPIGRQIDE